jgi:VanZ family protein
MTDAYTRAPTTRASGGRPWIAVVVWSATIMVFSCLPVADLPRLEMSGLDRVFHAAFYAVLAMLVARALATSWPDGTAVAAGTLVGSLAFGGLMEVLQGFVGRSPDVVDWAADAGGIMAALALRWAWFNLRERSR